MIGGQELRDKMTEMIVQTSNKYATLEASI